MNRLRYIYLKLPLLNRHRYVNQETPLLNRHRQVNLKLRYMIASTPLHPITLHHITQHRTTPQPVPHPAPPYHTAPHCSLSCGTLFQGSPTCWGVGFAPMGKCRLFARPPSSYIPFFPWFPRRGLRLQGFHQAVGSPPDVVSWSPPLLVYSCGVCCGVPALGTGSVRLC